MELKHKTALVTGACGGIGRAVVAALVAQGARVLAFDRDIEAVTALAEGFGNACDPIAVDLGDAAASAGSELASLAVQQSALPIEGVAVGAAAVVAKDAPHAVGGELEDAVVFNVGKVDVPVGVDGGPFGKGQ